MASFLIFAMCLALCLASSALYRYGNIFHQHFLVTVSVLIAWSFSFLIVFTIPLDVTSTLYRQCLLERNITSSLFNASYNQTVDENTVVNITQCHAPWSMIPESQFSKLWRVIYWSSQLLTWLIMPFMQSYLEAGDFSIKGKIKSALIENIMYYATYLFICGVLLAYLTAKGVTLDWYKLKATASSASNTWGLFLLIILLGYSLVEVPRSLWHNLKPGFSLQYAYFRTAKLCSERYEAEGIVEDILTSLHAISVSVPENHHLRPYVEKIVCKVPTNLQAKFLNHNSRIESNCIDTMPTEQSLIRIHKHVIKSLQTLHRIEALWNIQVENVLHLEDIAHMYSSNPCIQSKFPKQASYFNIWFYCTTLHWYWECAMKTLLLKTLFVFTSIMSIMVVWSELTFFQREPVLSIFANVINLINKYDFLTIEIFCMVILCYLFYCTYSTILRMRFLNLYYLAPHHQTNEHSLIFSGMLLCRFTPPMCLNFLSLIHMDSHIIRKRVMETHYTQIMGHMDVFSIISSGFNIYFPMCLLAFCLATWFSLGSKALHALGYQQFLQNETMVTELVQEGKDLVDHEKKTRRRFAEAIVRNQATALNLYEIRYPHINTGTQNPNARLYQNAASDDLLNNGDNLFYASLLHSTTGKRFGQRSQINATNSRLQNP